MRTLFTAAIGLALAATGAAVLAQPADHWQIGPIIRGHNYSVGMPLTPTPERRGWFFDFPYPDVEAGHVHYVTFPHGPLTGKRAIVMRYRIDAARGVRLVPRQYPQLPATISLFFQRRGDTWSGRGRYETYRWYAPVEPQVPLTPGVHELTVELDDNWKAVGASNVAKEPFAFKEAIQNAERVGFVMGSYGGRGHGVYATGPARFTLISFQVR